MPSNISRNQSTRVTPRSSSAAGATPATPTTQSTRAAGWSPGAATSALTIRQARITDVGPRTTERIALPRGYRGALETLSDKQTATVHGKPVSIEQNGQRLNVTGPNGRRFSVGTEPGELAAFAKDWKGEVAAAKAEPANEYTQLDWSAESGLRGAGTAGALFSVSRGDSSFMGGAHPNHGSALRTYDARTGRQVKLDELLSPRQMNALAKDIEARLTTLRGPEGLDGSSFAMDSESLRRSINENFTVTADKNGKVKIDIAWESGVHALGSYMAHFTVDAPNDAAFRAKIGL